MLAVLAGMVFASALSPATAYAENPHVPATVTSISCPLCHDPHQAAVGDSILKDVKGGQTGLNQVTFCYGCHDGSLAINVKTGTTSNVSFEGSSGHSVEPTSTTADLTHVCADCHNPHADSAMQPRLPRASITVTLTTGVTEEREVTEEPNSWCFACHDDDQIWYTSTTETPYPQLSSPITVASGYPDTGTFPGETTYKSATNAHANIPAGSMTTSHEATRVEGDCLWCHSGHRGKSEYDGLVDTFGAAKNPASADDLVRGDYAAVCLRCHKTGGLVGAAAVDIASKVLADAEDANALTTALNGHRVRSSGGDLPVNSPLPCYMCHNPHGSTRNNKTLLSDTLGANLDTSTDAGMRAFCFTCHTSYDEADDGTGTMLPYGWDSEADSGAGGYVLIDASEEVVGLRRAADEASHENKLRLWRARGHKSTDTENCIDCHIDVHAPMSGKSLGGQDCLECHKPLNPMVDSKESYHHVLDATVVVDGYGPGYAPGTLVDPSSGNEYPVSPSALACVSCHVDHDMYEDADAPVNDPAKADGKAFSLRSSATDPTPDAVDTDDGLCLSCHSVERERNNTGQKDPVLSKADNVIGISPTYWYGDDAQGIAKSPHNYTASGTFDDGSSFRANCAKCHGTLEATLSSGRFAVHTSAEQRLINALGDDNTHVVNEECMCYRCHSYAADPIGGDRGAKVAGSDGSDFYGAVTTMKPGSLGVWRQFQYGLTALNPGSRHPVATTNAVHAVSPSDEDLAYISANKHVECADCHNHHVVGEIRHDFGSSNLVSDSIRGVSGVKMTTNTSNWNQTQTLTWTTNAEREYEICFKCHSRANTGMYTTWNESGWTDVAREFNPGNQSYHPVVQALPLQGDDPSTSWGSSRLAEKQLSGGWMQGDTMWCSDCHGDSMQGTAEGPHGSSVPYILKETVPSTKGPRVYWPNRPEGTPYTIDNVAADGLESQLFCSNCHINISGNRAHEKSDMHKSGPCTQCHILVPHGGKMSRLIGDGSPTSTMPTRYAAGGNRSSIKVASFQKQQYPDNYGPGNCAVTDTACQRGKYPHPYGEQSGGSWENW